MEWTIKEITTKNIDVIINGKIKRIDKKEIMKNMRALNITRDNAIQMWLEDNDLLINEEQQALIEKTKDVKVNHAATASERKPRKAPIRQPNETKLLIKKMFLERLESEGIQINKSTEKEGQFEFDLNGKHYTINIKEKREKKAC